METHIGSYNSSTAQNNSLYGQDFDTLEFSAVVKFAKALLLVSLLGGTNFAWADAKEELSTDLLAIRSASQLDGKVTGFAATKSERYLAYEHLTPLAKQNLKQLHQILHASTPAGRLYAAALIWRADPDEGRKAVLGLLKDESKVSYFPYGCGGYDLAVNTIANRMLKDGPGKVLDDDSFIVGPSKEANGIKP